MTCDERQDLILLYAADALDADERMALAAHLAAGCPRCAGSLAEAEATVAHLPLGLDEQPAPAAARDRIMRRVLADASSAPRGTAASASRPPTGNRGLWMTLAAAAAVVLVVVGVTMRTITRNYHDRLTVAEAANRDLGNQLSLRDATLADLQLALAQSTRDAQALNASDLKLVSLSRQDPQPQAHGRILWDRDRNEWHVRVFDMKPPPPGKTYELWFITPDQKKIPAGTFHVDATGRGQHTVKVPPDIGPIQLAAVTDEPLGGVLQPTGQIQLVGAIQ